MTERNVNPMGVSGFDDFVEAATWRTWENEMRPHFIPEVEAIPVAPMSFHPASSGAQRTPVSWSTIAKSRFSNSIRHTPRFDPVVGSAGLLALHAIETAVESQSATPSLEVEVLREVKERLSDRTSRSRAELDVKYVVSRLREFLGERPARNWLFSFNEMLSTRPVDALALSKTGAVIDAMDALEDFAY